jgi:Calcineurin-like phosphoesterase
VGHSSYAISPGFFSGAETVARKPRDLPRFYADVRGMTRSHARWQLVDSFNDWGSGTAVEPATEWASASGHGSYLDALRAGGVPPPDTATVAAAAGDIGCSITEAAANAGTTQACQAPATAALARSLGPAFVITMGDDMHGRATLDDYRAGYDPSWGALRAITYPAIGNHQYCNYGCSDPVAGAAAGYFAYWGSRAGTPGQGWYSYDRGGWHIVVLNSECKEQGGCGTGSPMETWLRADLAAHPAPCTLAYWHRPRFTGGHEGEAPSMGPIWSDLYRAGVELVLNGHQHQYERFAPQAPDRSPDASGGITEIVSGTGGRSHIAPVTVKPNTIVQNANTFGVLRLELHPLSWSARFVPAPGLGSFTDTAGGDCH